MFPLCDAPVEVDQSARDLTHIPAHMLSPARYCFHFFDILSCFIASQPEPCRLHFSDLKQLFEDFFSTLSNDICTPICQLTYRGHLLSLVTGFVGKYLPTGESCENLLYWFHAHFLQLQAMISPPPSHSQQSADTRTRSDTDAIAAHREQPGPSVNMLEDRRKLARRYRLYRFERNGDKHLPPDRWLLDYSGLEVHL